MACFARCFRDWALGAPRNAPKSVATPTHRGPRPIAAVPNRHSGRCSAHADRVRATGSSPQPPCNDPLGNTDGSMRQSRGSGRASVPHCGCRLPAAILSGFSHPKARYFLVATRKYPKKRSPGSAAAHPAAALEPALASAGSPKARPCAWDERRGPCPTPLGRSFGGAGSSA